MHPYLPHFLHGNIVSGSCGGFTGALLFFAAGSARGLWAAARCWVSLFTVFGSWIITIVTACSTGNKQMFDIFDFAHQWNESFLTHLYVKLVNRGRGLRSALWCAITKHGLWSVVTNVHSHEPVVTGWPSPADCSRGSGHKKHSPPPCRLDRFVWPAVNSVMMPSRKKNKEVYTFRTQLWHSTINVKAWQMTPITISTLRSYKLSHQSVQTSDWTPPGWGCT